jgi:hypothetical protein
MGLTPLGVLDLSLVTNTLISMLENYVTTASPLWQALESSGQTFQLSYSGAMPDAVRKQAGCQLTLSLIHVIEDKYQRNAALLNQRAQTIPFQPMSLDLYYLLSTFDDDQQSGYQHEQQAMSMALQFFYQTPIVRLQGPLPPGLPFAITEEFSLTMEMETSDELARLWQAITVPFRTGVVYKVSVVLLTPPTTPALATKVATMQLAADPTVFPYASSGQLVGTVRTVSFASLDSTVGKPVILTLDYSPAVAVPGPNLPFILYGANLNQASSNNVYLLMPDGTEINVTAWMVPEPVMGVQNFQTPSRITLQLPLTVGTTPPATAPVPGVYQLSVGTDAGTKYRTNPTPFSVGAWIDTSSVPQPNPPILQPAGGIYTVHGEGFIAGATQVLLDTIELSGGQFNVVSAEQLTFTAPGGLAAGTYTVRIRVNNVETPPAWWVTIP